MATWYKVVLSGEDVSAGKHMTLQEEFQNLFMVNLGQQDAAMFTTSRELRAPYPYFFSPGAASIAKLLIDRYRGVECAAPEASELSLLVGNASLDQIPFSTK